MAFVRRMTHVILELRGFIAHLAGLLPAGDRAGEAAPLPNADRLPAGSAGRGRYGGNVGWIRMSGRYVPHRETRPEVGDSVATAPVPKSVHE
jgi:hypothetical protein